MGRLRFGDLGVVRECDLHQILSLGVPQFPHL